VKHLIFVATALLAITSLVEGARAQANQGRVFAYVEPDRGYLGTSMAYVVVVENLSGAQPPDVQLDWATVSYQGSNSVTSSSNFNGRLTRTVQNRLQYALVPTKAGTFEIPSQTIRVGGKQYETNAVRVVISEPERLPSTAGGSVDIRLDADEVWEGQSVRGEIVWTLPDFGGSSSISGFRYSGGQPDGVAIEPRGGSQRRRGEQYEVNVWGQRMIGRVANVTGRDGRARRSMVVEFDLLPKRSGTIELGPIDVGFNVADRFGRGAAKRYVESSTPVELRVFELPEAGRPETFGGLVGRFAIDMIAEPTNVNVGDPIDVLITIKGEEPMRGVRSGPDLSDQPEWDPFRIGSDGWRFEPGGAFGQRLFRTTVRAGDDSIQQLPPIELAYFDPSAGEYRVAKTSPIPLSVQSVKEFTSADAVVSGGGVPTISTGGVAREPPEDAGAGTWANDLGASVLAADAFNLSEAVRSPVYLIAFALPPLTLGAVTLARTIADRRDPGAAKRRSASSAGLRALRRDGVDAGVRVFVGDRFGLSRAAVTATDCRELAERFGSDSGRELASMLASAEAVTAGGGDHDRVQVSEAARLIRAFDRDASKSEARR